MQRLRLRFGGEEEVKFISHLDVLRFGERAFRRAKIPLRLFEKCSARLCWVPAKIADFCG